MRAWTRSCGSLGKIESGHREDGKTNVPRRTGESIHPLVWRWQLPGASQTLPAKPSLIQKQHCLSPSFAANKKKQLQQNYDLLLQQTST
jgi:hypothetical protein